MWILVKFTKISILVKFLKNFDLNKIVENFWCFRKFRTISILVKIFKNFEKFRFHSYFQKINRVKLTKKFEFGQNFRKIWILVKFSKKKSILVNFSKKTIDFVQNFRKFRKTQILFKFSKNFNLSRIFELNSILVKTFQKFQF